MIVKKKDKPVPDFSVYVSHKNKVLFEKTSDAKGEILIEIPFDKLTLKPFVVEILPTLSFRFSNFKNFLEVYNLKKSTRILSILMAFAMLIGNFSVMGSAYHAYKGTAIAGDYNDVDSPDAGRTLDGVG